MYGAEYLENVLRYRLGYNGAPIGNGTWSTKWSRARWRHVTLFPVCRGTGGLAEIAPFERFFLPNMVSLEILKDKQQFLQHENSFMIHVCKNIVSEIILKKIKYKSLEDSEEHCSVVCNSLSQFHICKNVHYHFYGLTSSCSCHPSTMPDNILGILLA